MPEGLLVLGVDAGGTKTDAVVCDTAGAVRGFGSGGRGNWEYDGLEQARLLSPRPSTPRSPGQAQTPIRSPPRCSHSRDSTGRSTTTGSSPSWPASRWAASHVLVNDAFAALRAGCRAEHGAVSIAGTGSVTAASNRAGRRSAPWRSATASAAAALTSVREGLDAIARTRHGQAARRRCSRSGTSPPSASRRPTSCSRRSHATA